MKSDIPFVSVIILNYNGITFIDRCLSSVLESNYDNREIIFVDNASTDGSIELVKNKYQGIRVIRNNKNLGFMKGCNVGIRASFGEIIVLLNIDTEVRKDWLVELVEVMRKDKSIRIVGSKLLYPGGTHIQHAGSVIHDNGLTDHIGNMEMDLGQYDQLSDVDYVSGASVAIDRKFLESIGLIDEGYSPLYYDDPDLAIQAGRQGYRVVLAPKSVVIHFETHATQKSSLDFIICLIEVVSDLF